VDSGAKESVCLKGWASQFTIKDCGGMNFKGADRSGIKNFGQRDVIMRSYQNGPSMIINPYDIVVDVIHVTVMDEAYVADIDDEYFVYHDYDYDTDDDTDDDTEDDADDDMHTNIIVWYV